MSASAAPTAGASGAAAAFASLAHSFSQLLDCMENPHEHNVTRKEMADLLTYLTPRFLQNLSSFKSTSSTTTPASTILNKPVKSSFPNEKGEYESQVLHEDWKKIVEELSETMQLDVVQSYHILETYLHLYHYNNLSHFFTPSPSSHSSSTSGASSSATSNKDGSTLNLSELIHFYYTERNCLLQCISVLFRIFLDDTHPYHAEVVTVLKDLCKQGLEKELLKRYKMTCATQIPTVKAAAAAASSTTTTSPSSLFSDDPILATSFADQIVLEQALLLEILFLLYYENDAFTPEATEASSTEAQARILDVYSMFNTQQFGRVQPLYPFLSARGRTTVDWLSHLSLLIALELMSFEKLMRVYNHPIADMLALIARGPMATAVDSEDADDMIEQYETHKEAAIVIIQESEMTFKEHPFSDLNFLAKMDHLFFEQLWNTRIQSQPQSAAQFHGAQSAHMLAIFSTLNLAWSISLSHVYEYLEDIQNIKLEFGLLGVDEETGKNKEPVEYGTEKQIILTRLEASVSNGTNTGVSANPFQLLTHILTRLQNLSLSGSSTGAGTGSASTNYALESSCNNLPAFKEIVHELLNALFQSTCYSALLSISTPQSLQPIFPLFNRIFYEDSSLGFRFWKQDEEHPEDRSPLFEEAIEKFTEIDLNPFIDLLTALSGATVKRPLRFNSNGDAIEQLDEQNDVTISDSMVCANRVYETLRNMKFLTTSTPPDHLLASIEQQPEYNVMLIGSWVTPDGTLLPANTVGRFIPGAVNMEPRFMQWWHSYSAWPILIARIEAAWKAIRGIGTTLSAQQWIEVVNITHLISKLVRADANIYALLSAHLTQQENTNNDTALTIYDNNTSSFAQAYTAQRKEVHLLVLLMRIQAYVSLHAGSIVANANQAALNATKMMNQSMMMSMMDSTMNDGGMSQSLLLQSSSTGVQLTSAHLLTLLESTTLILEVSARHDWSIWLRAFQLVMGSDMNSPSSSLATNATQANLLSNVPLLAAKSSYQPTYSYIFTLQQSFVNIQSQRAHYSVHITFLDHLSTLLLPLYQLATIQNMRLNAPMSGSSFLPPQTSDVLRATATDTRSSLAVNPSFTDFLSTFDMHHFLKYVCESIFVQYEEWPYEVRAERWNLGSQILRFFTMVLANPTAPTVLPKNYSTTSTQQQQQQQQQSSLHSISLQQYLYTLFLTQPSMLLALLRPLLFGLSLLDRLNYDRHHDSEIILLQDLLIHTFLVLKKLLNLESQQAGNAVVQTNGSSKVASFYSVLLETVAAANVPSAWSHLNKRRGGRFTATPNSLLQAITEYAGCARSVELQSLAIQTVRLLCLSGGSSSTTPNAPGSLATFFVSHALQSFRRTCFQLLTAHTTELSLKLQVLQLLATMFERQPALAQRFAVSSFVQQLQRLQGTLGTGEDGADDDSVDDEDSLFQVLKAYVLSAEDAFTGDPQALLLIYRILAAIWSSSRPIGSMAVGTFTELQQRLRKEVPNLWEKLTHCLTAEIQVPESNDDAMDTSSSSPDLSSLNYLLSIKLIRQCVWTIVNTEIFMSLGFGPTQQANGTANPTASNLASSQLDPALESILLSYGASSTTPHRYIQFLLAYCHTSEHVSVHRQTLDQLQQYHLDFSIFTTTPTSEEYDEGMMRSPVYNLELIQKVMQYDLDLAFERESAGGAMDDSQLNHSMNDHSHSTSTSLVLHDGNTGRMSASSHRTRIEQLITNLKRVNNSMMIADAELSLLQAWKCFVQLCLQKQPALLGIKPKSGLAFEYIQQLSNLLADEQRFGAGAVMCGYLQNVSSLLLSFLTAGLASTESSTVLSSAILIHLSRSASRSERDENAAGESVFRAANDLLAKIAFALKQSTKAYVIPLSVIGSLDSLGVSRLHMISSSINSPSSNRIAPFDIMNKISTSVLANRVLATLPTISSGVMKRAPTTLQLGHHTIALTSMQNLMTASMILIRWSNQLLIQQYSLQRADQFRSPPQTNTRLTSPPVRRLNDAFGSPSGRSSLPGLAPVLETQQSVTTSRTSLASAIGNEYEATCQSMMNVLSSCLIEGRLTDGAVTVIPLILQAIDIVQGAQAEAAARNNGTEQSTRDQVPIIAALEQLKPLLPVILKHFATMPVTLPSIAVKLMRLLGLIAQYEHGAEYLIQQSIVLHICHHRLFNPPSGAQPINVPGSSTPYHPSFAPYTPANTRDEWHQVWVESIRTLTTLLRTMSKKSQLRTSISMTSDSLRSSLTATHSKLLEEILGFFNLFSSSRINASLHLTQIYQLTVGSLDEIDALTHLIYEFELYGQLWHRVNPLLHSTQRQQMLLIAAYYMRLLNDHRELEKRVLPVSPSEKADAKGDEDENDAQKNDSHPSVVRQPSEDGKLERTRSDGLGGAPATTAEEKQVLEAKKKAAWRPLGASSGINTGTSTPTPTTPRSTSTPLSAQTPSAMDTEKTLPQPSPPARMTSSFLLRSPAVRSLENTNTNNLVGTGSISGSLQADNKHSQSLLQQRGFAYFIQKIEYSMCLILRSCMSYLRLHSKLDQQTQERFQMKQILFSHRIKVVTLGNTSNGMMNNVFNPFLPSGSAVAGSGSSSSQFFLSTHSSPVDPSRSIHTTPKDKIVQIFSGLGIGIEEDMQSNLGVDGIDFESDYYTAANSYGDDATANQEMDYSLRNDVASNGFQNGRTISNPSSYTFRPALSILVDFSTYNLRVLTRLFEIQKQSGGTGADDEAAGRKLQRSDDDDEAYSSSSSSSALFALNVALSTNSGASSSSSPSIPNIHSAMQFLLETTLYILTQHLQVHIRQLIKIQMEYIAQIQIVHHQQQQQINPPSTPAAAYYQQQPQHHDASLSQSIVPPAAIRLGKLLDQYRERLASLIDLLARYIQLLNTPDAAPPSLSNANTTAIANARAKELRLIYFLKGQLDDIAMQLTKHQLTTRHIFRSTTAAANQRQTNEQQQYQYQQPQQYR